jgi:oligopeptide/dipeptide ABC transporter ATP-binding protein
MYLGKLCEIGPVRSIFTGPLHPYTLALLNSIPSPDPTVGRRDTASVISGELPSPLDPPSGCRFRTRCPRAADRCAAEVPELRQLGDGHLVACHFPLTAADSPAHVTAAAQVAAPVATSAAATGGTEGV